MAKVRLKKVAAVSSGRWPKGARFEATELSRERRPSNWGSRQYQKASAGLTEKVGVWLYGNASEISLGIALTALGLEPTILAQVTHRVTGEHLHGVIKPERQTESSDGEMSGEKLGTLLRQVSKTSIDEVDSLIVELKTLHKKLQTDGDRIQRDIAEHAELSQQVMQLTKIISDSVKKLRGRAA